ncbi:hypothetical protein Fcan01_15383 [Folsomia candida]|uniref:Uncharacterized protein n=1 Tax=Folsomia candida TaxID=158441 RepID=A0A226DV51_FOLCA|nr:hypothetical protein Fcan01_15383 [Folsomia candida]
MALVMPGVQILLCYTAMQAVHSEQISKFVAFLFVQTYLTILTFSIFLFSATAQINNVSTKWILECKTLGRTRLEMRMQKSLTSLRLEFGNNFVEALTPLVVQDFCVRQTVSGLFLTGYRPSQIKPSFMNTIWTKGVTEHVQGPFPSFDFWRLLGPMLQRVVSLSASERNSPNFVIQGMMCHLAVQPTTPSRPAVQPSSRPAHPLAIQLSKIFKVPQKFRLTREISPYPKNLT